MAEKYWIGGDTGNEADFDTAANWSPVGVPASGDTLIFSNMANKVPTDWAGDAKQKKGTAFSVTTNLDQSSKDFAKIVVHDSYDGNIGYGLDAGVYYALRCAAADVLFAGSGDLHIVSQHATGAIDRVINNSNNGHLYIGKGYTGGQKTASLVNAGQYVDILAAEGTTLAAPEIDTLVSVSGRGEVIIPEDNTSTALIIRNVLGKVTAFCNIDILELAGGTVNWGEEDYTPATAKTLNKLLQYAGKLQWDMAGTLKECHVYNGVFSVSGYGNKTIGDSTLNNGTIEVYNGTLDLSEALNNCDLGIDCEVQVLGKGSFNVPKFTDIVFGG